MYQLLIALVVEEKRFAILLLFNMVNLVILGLCWIFSRNLLCKEFLLELHSKQTFFSI